MPKTDDWTHCQECDEEFNVISSISNKVEYCPYCGEYIAFDEQLEDFDDDMDL